VGQGLALVVEQVLAGTPTAIDSPGRITHAAVGLDHQRLVGLRIIRSSSTEECGR
jgi:hypothetical protein